MLVGLTGAYCAGKNYISAIIETLGVPVLDVDKLGYAAIEMEKERIFARFGAAVRKPDGSVDRRLLGRKVFGVPAELADLEAIVHPAANSMAHAWVEAQGGKTCVVNAALLHRTTLFNKFDKIIIAEAPFFTRLARAKKRDGVSYLELLRRFSSQKNFASQYLSGNAEIHRVKNLKSSKEELERQIAGILA